MMLTLQDTHTNERIHVTTGTEPLPVGFLRENGRYRITLEAEGQCDMTLLISDEEMLPATKELTPDKTHIRWDWYIEEYAGEVVLSLVHHSEPMLEAVLDIAPNPYKLGAEVYDELLVDLQEKAEGLLFGTTPAQALLQHQEADVPPLASFALMRSYLPALERAFRNIEQAPHRILVAEREERSLPKVRRVDTHSLQSALKRMPVLAALKNRQTSGVRQQTTLDVPRRVHTFDTSPNRHTLALLFRLGALCEDLCQRFHNARSSSHEEPEFRRRAERWHALSQRFHKQLMRMRRAAFLTEVRPSKPDAAALLAIARHPAYSHFDRIARRILCPRVALGGDSDKMLCLRNTYEIYEYWCFFTVVDAIQVALPEITWESNISISPSRLLLDLKNGSSLDGVWGSGQISLVFQQKYTKTQDSNGLFSISKTCIPDIVLTVKTCDEVRTIILDAKYRSSWESIHAALSDIHVYRDAIRTDGDQPAIDAAFILTPAHHAGLDRYYTDDYRSRFHFGGFDLLPRKQNQVNALVAMIRDWVRA